MAMDYLVHLSIVDPGDEVDLPSGSEIIHTEQVVTDSYRLHIWWRERISGTRGMDR